MPLFRENPYKTPRFAASDIKKVAGKLNCNKCVVLVDEFSNSLDFEYERYNVDEGGVEGLRLIDADAFIYAIDCDEVGAKVISEIDRLKKPFYPVNRGTAKYLHVKRHVREALWEEHEADVRDGITHFNEPDFLNIAQAIDITKNISGSYVEVGTFNGAAARFALRYMSVRSVFRPCFFLDTFTGFDYESAKTSVDRTWAGTHMSHGYETVRDRLNLFSTENRSVNVVRNNIITDEVPAEIGKIAIANLDVDILEGIRSGIRKLAPRIAPGGCLLVEDTGHTPMLIGARLALNEFLEGDSLAKQFIPITFSSAQTMLIRKR